ncbi:MAG TPA: hypothetical protein VFE22_14730 [Edaphobacter sp.]|nr:hypothetical protein [Edaphobacter sp.]
MVIYRNAAGAPVKQVIEAVHTSADDETHGDESGDIIYGAPAIARYIFKDDAHQRRAERRVYNLAAHHRGRKEAAGFFKMKGALCLSKSQWRKFHRL